MVSTDGIVKAIAASKRWETKGRDLPDLIRAADYRSYPEATATCVRDRLSAGASRSAYKFPYPKGETQTREFVLADPLDDLALRYLAGPAVAHTDALLSRQVLTYRLDKNPPGWRCRLPGPSVARRRDEARAFVLSDSFGGLGVSDIRSFYNSIDRVVLAALLESCCPRGTAIQRLLWWLDELSARTGVPGLPIGPEASGLLANAYLLPLDHELGRLTTFFRVTDDLWIFVGGAEEWVASLAMVDFMLSELGLVRSTEKTDFMDDPGIALSFVRDPVLSTVDAAFMFDQELGREAVRDLVDQIQADPLPSLQRLRYALNASRRLRDTYATSLLLARPELMELDPRVCGDYLCEVARMSRRKPLEPFLPLLERASSPRTEAVRLQLLRALGLRSWGRDEGNLFEGFARMRCVPPNTRGYALLAWSRTPSRSTDDAVDIAVIQDEPLDVRRGAVLSLTACPNTAERNRAASR